MLVGWNHLNDPKCTRQTSGDASFRKSHPERGVVVEEEEGEGAVFPFVGIKQRVSINFCFKLWKTATETYEILETVYGNYAQYCTQSFNEGKDSQWVMTILNMIQGTLNHQLLKSKTQLQSVVYSVLGLLPQVIAMNSCPKTFQ